MKDKLKIFLASCLSAASSIPAFMVMPQESSAAQLGGLNITQDVCRSQTYVLYVKPVVLNSGDAYSWRCRVYPLPFLSGPFLYQTGIDLTRVCQQQYGRGAYASPTNTRNAYSWQCFR